MSFQQRKDKQKLLKMTRNVIALKLIIYIKDYYTEFISFYFNIKKEKNIKSNINLKNIIKFK